jgi:hypothetical protein
MLNVMMTNDTMTTTIDNNVTMTPTNDRNHNHHAQQNVSSSCLLAFFHFPNQSIICSTT